ncbi:hypothetical protein ABZ517_29290 [Streptomyces scabiei]|uniref:hypothetical protein n=1 Tax=Streptomyces scabiei TaxID=1930 RepID=UPI0033FD631E
MNGRTAQRRPTVKAVTVSRDDHPTALWANAHVTELLGDDTTPPPRYGTREWQQLPSSAPHKAAAVITAAEMWRKYGDEEDLLAWFRDASRNRDPLASRRTLAELDAAAKAKPAWPVQAADGWPPVVIPGRPGWRRHLVDGRQVDLPHDRSGATAA